jgi:hypothetical protein
MKWIGILFFLPCMHITFAQNASFRYDSENQLVLEKLELQSGQLFTNHLQIKPYDKSRLTQELILRKDSLSDVDRVPFEKIWNEHSDELILSGNKTPSGDKSSQSKIPFRSQFYKDDLHFLSIYTDHFHIGLDPLLYFDVGVEDKQVLFINRRGISISGSIDKILYFNTNLLETQLHTPQYVENYIELYKSFPGAGLFKKYKSRLFNSDGAYDFLVAEASAGLKLSRHIHLSVGHGRHFIGSGIRSLLLSDFATPQFYFKINTNVWRLHYQNIFSELTAESLADEGNRLLNKKYMAAHYLSVNITKNWNAGIFESVVFSRDRGFELQYLNPVILYRFVEQSLGSPDNVFIGFHTNFLFRKKFNCYAQLFFDEFVMSEFFKSGGWWGNKYGLQIGVKYTDAFGVKNLFLQAEYNQVRPYTYTFRDSISNYSHYNQSLAHPLGANFIEGIFRIHYLPGSRWSIGSQTLFYKKGLDANGINYGGNILLDYDTRRSDYDNTITQGLLQTVFKSSLHISYQIFRKTWLDVNLNYRNDKSGQLNKGDFWISGGFRMNLDRMQFEF